MSIVQDKILLLKGQVQHYDWGGYNYIPAWLDIENKEHKPFAEYWMGAHTSAPSVVETKNGELNLHNLIFDDTENMIGKKVKEKFGDLPYLFKILDVQQMLSIQVHPTKEEAEKGFAEEEAAGKKIGAAQRNYKDKNHKPEVMVALSEFWLLHGFLQYDELLHVIKYVPEFTNLKEHILNGGYKGLYQFVMELPQQKVNEILQPLVKREIEKKVAGQLTKDQPGWWVAKYYEGKDVHGDIDRGIFSVYFLNIVKANPGEGIFQKAGLLHAYLEGQNVELMANSDNVLRGGLTTKHVDVPELIKHVKFEGITPNVLTGDALNKNETNYPCPVPDFGIHKIELNKDEQLTATTSSLEIWVIISGRFLFESNCSLEAAKGNAVAVLPDQALHVKALESGLIYKAFVP